MMTKKMIPLSYKSADDRLLLMLEELVGNADTAEGFFGSLNYSDVAALADFALSRSKPLLAGLLVREWKYLDEDWEEQNDEGDVDSWLELLPADARSSWRRSPEQVEGWQYPDGMPTSHTKRHYFRDGVSLCRTWNSYPSGLSLSQLAIGDECHACIEKLVKEFRA